MIAVESAQERGLSAAMREIAAAYGEAAEAVRREKKARPDAGVEFGGVRQPRSGEYGVQIWDPLRGNNAWLGTASKAYDAAAVEVHGAAAKTNFKSPAAVRFSAGVTVVKEEIAQEQGLTYRFFQQLEALHGPAGATHPVAMAVAVPGMVGPSAVRALPEPPSVGVTAGMATPAVVGGNLSFPTSNMGERGKRERTWEGGAAAGAGSGEMMRFFEGLTKQAMERQEAMQQRFVKMEQDRVIREEAWRRQEMARLTRDQEILAQERAMAAPRDASVLSFIQKISGQTIPMPYMSSPPPSSETIAYAAPPSSQPAPLVAHQSSTDIVMIPVETLHDSSGYHGSGGGGGAASSSRWLKAEEHALIQLRCDLYMRRKRRKGLWEEISEGMRRMGYSRSSQRCREKWWNMNNRFKKVKESNTMRPEDSRTFYRFHQIDAFHRYKAALGSPAGAGGVAAEHAPNAAPRDREAFAVTAPMSQMAPQPHSLPHVGRYGGNGHGVGGVSGRAQMQASDRFVFSEAGGRAAVKKVIKLETNVHSRVGTGGTYMWYPAPTADDINPEHAQMIDLNQAPVAAKVSSNVEVQRRSDSLPEFSGLRLYGGKYYLAQIMEPGLPATRQLLGIFDTVEEATRAYDDAALRLYGAAAKTNFEQPPMGATADDLQEPAAVR